MFKTFYVDTVEDLIVALTSKLKITRDSVEYAKIKQFILGKINKECNAIVESLHLIWKKNEILIEPMESFLDGNFTCKGYTVSSIPGKDVLFEPYTVTGFNNLLYSLGERFKVKPSESTMIEVKNLLKGQIPAGQTDLTGPCGLYIKKYPIYINALATYSEVLEMWTTEYVVTCGDKRSDLPMFNIS
ncbi:MAG: hypothetical protein IJ272_08945 [Clostridia bacterium]|nr:hypothetical protein [Clostridia bacterium]